MGYHTIGVVGGGAAGMMAAITAARQGARVTLLEGGGRVGRKLLSTGNGKCNLGNLALDADCYHGADRKWISRCLEQFDTGDTISFFRELGLFLKEKNGYLYPMAEQAAVALDALRHEIEALDIRVVANCKVGRIEREAGAFRVYGETGDFLFDRVILACGGKAAPKTGSDGSGYGLARQMGHALVPVAPALAPLCCREEFLKSVAGVRAEALVRVQGLPGDRELAERGEVQLTDYGISGIPVFQLSGEVNRFLLERGKGAEAVASLDFFPDYSREEYAQMCTVRKLLMAGRTVEAFFTGMLHKKLMALFIRLAGLKPGEAVEDAAEEKLDMVFALCRDWRLHVTGSHSFDSAQVCAGGVDCAQVGTDMGSRLAPGLYFAGEILDVDGRCGGYNLQWAWCSGYLAGRAAAGTTY